MVLLATKRDRLARDTMYAAMIERLVARKHATVHTCDGAGNGDSPEDFILRDMLDAHVERLEAQTGLKASRTEVCRHALRLYLEEQSAPAKTTTVKRTRKAAR